jgi:hypothetical protein
MVLTLKRFPVHLSVSEVPLTYGIMTVPWYVVSEEGRLHYGVNEFLWVFSKYQIVS